MAIEVMIRRKVKQGPQAKAVVPLILQLRALATFQPGYISGETLSNLDDPEDCLVISRWDCVEDWKAWMKNEDRNRIQKKIDTLTAQKTEYTIYAPMVARPQL